MRRCHPILPERVCNLAPAKQAGGQPIGGRDGVHASGRACRLNDSSRGRAAARVEPGQQAGGGSEDAPGSGRVIGTLTRGARITSRLAPWRLLFKKQLSQHGEEATSISSRRIRSRRNSCQRHCERVRLHFMDYYMTGRWLCRAVRRQR
jgi:hypothetical protein